VALTVAIVDNNALLRDGIAALLFLPISGLRVVMASDCDDAALTALQSTSFRVALIGISGANTPSSLSSEASDQTDAPKTHFELAMRLMHLADKPRVVLMNQTPEVYPKAMIQAGVSGFLSTHADLDELVKSLRLAGMGKSYISPSLSTAWAQEGLCNEQERFAELSARELAVMHYVLAEKRVPEIAELLSINPKTVATYRSRMMEKLGVRSDLGLFKLVQSTGLCS